MLWYFPKNKVSLFLICVNLLYKSYLMLGGLLWMYAWSIQWLWLILDMFIRGDFNCTVELRPPATLVLSLSFGIKSFAIHHNMGPAQSGNTCW